MKNHISIGASVLALIIAGGVWMTGNPPQVTQMPNQEPNKEFGSQAQSVADGNCFIGPTGGHVCSMRAAVVATSSVLCAIRGPNATTTIMAPQLSLSSTGGIATADAVRFYLSTSTSLVGSSTPYIGTALLNATNFYVFSTNVASTSIWTGQLVTQSAQGAATAVLGPNQWLTFRVATGTPSAFSTYPAGYCAATLVY